MVEILNHESCTYRIGHDDSLSIAPSDLYNENIQFMSNQDPEAELQNKMICRYDIFFITFRVSTNNRFLSALNETSGEWRILDPEVKDSHILPLGTLFKVNTNLKNRDHI